MEQGKRAFTLAEVLVTLAIVGVLASMTIPTLLQSLNDAQYKTAYKKAFSVATQAWMRAVNDGITTERPVQSATTDNANFNAFQSYFNVVKQCNNNDNSNCWASGEMYWVVHPKAACYAFIDSSGMAWTATSSTTTATSGELLVDTNGNKLPNKFGKDRFILGLETSDGQAIGTIVKVDPAGDIPTADTNYCPSGGCYYNSWLSQ